MKVTRERHQGLARRIVSPLATSLLALGGCGSGSPPAPETADQPPARPQELSPAKQQRAFEAQQTITAYCARFDLSLHGARRPPSAADARRAHDAAGRLSALVRARPFDLVQTGVDTRLYVGDLIEDLGNVSCDPDLVGKLEEGLG